MQVKFFNALVIIYLTLIAFYIEAEEEECDILCRAGVEPAPLELKDKEKSDKKKPEKERTFKIAEPSNLIISDTQSTQILLNNFTAYVNDLLQAQGEKVSFSISIGSARGDRHNFSISNMKVFFEDFERYTLFEIDQISCSDGKYSGVGVNDMVYFTDLYNFKLPNIDYIYMPHECNLSGLDINLPTIFALAGTDYGPTSVPMSLFGTIEKASSDIDLGYSVKINKDKASFKIKFNFANQLKFSASETISINKQLVYETLETIRSSVLIETKYTEEKIINNREEFYSTLFNIIEEGYFLDAFNDEMDYFNASNPLKLYGMSYEIAWSDELFRQISSLSNGVVDGGMLALKAYTISKMNRYEFIMLLESLELGLEYERQGLFGDILYKLYSETFDEAKRFVNNPKGLGISIDSPNGIDNSTLMRIEEYPALIFTILNNINFRVYANPDF